MRDGGKKEGRAGIKKTNTECFSKIAEEYKLDLFR